MASGTTKKKEVNNKTSKSVNNKANSNVKKSAAKNTNSSRKHTTSAAVNTNRQMILSDLPVQESTNPILMKEAIMWLILAVCILLFISYLGIGGYVGEIFSDLSFGIFGFCAYLFPFLLFFSAAFLISNKGSRLASVKFTFSAVLYVCICCFAGLISGEYEEAGTLMGLFDRSASYHTGGGMIGGGICQLLAPALGAVGTGIVLLIFSIISIVMITQKSVMGSMRHQGEKVYRSAKESTARRREAHMQERQRREEWERFERDAKVQETPVPVERVAPSHRVSSAQRVRSGQHMMQVDRVAPEHTRQRSAVLEPSSPEQIRPSKSGRTELEVPVIFPVSRRENRSEHRISGVTMDTKLVGNTDTVYISLDEEKQESVSEPAASLHSSQERVPFRIEGIHVDEEADVQDEMIREFNHEQDIDLNTESEIESDTEADREFIREFDLESERVSSYIDKEKEELPVLAVEPEDTSSEDEEDEKIIPEPVVVSDVSSTRKRKIDTGDIFRKDNGNGAPSSAGTVFTQEETVPSKRNPRSSEKEIADGIASVQEEMNKAAEVVKPEYVFPPISLLKKGKGKSGGKNQELEIRSTAMKLEQTLKSFGVNVTVTNVSCGPSVTRYEIQPEQGVKVSRIVSLADDIKLNLAAADIRIEAPIPGKAAVGIEVPNTENSAVALRDLLESDEFTGHGSRLAFATGKDIGGKVVVSDIAKMPHLLIAGATGSGKSVCINTLIMSILYKAHPDEVKLIMIDPKVVELSVYNGIPHLFIPVVTDPKKAAGALNWAVAEMTDRYNKFAEYGVRDLKGYNQKIEAIADIQDENKPKKLPQIVIIVDELADLMMVAPGEVEDAICRLAQLARACGIHLIIATQRPSVNVITGLIKANMPSRIAFSVSSGVDSRTILDMNGAEKLLGKGDMLFSPQGYPKPARVQGAFVSDEEVADVVDFLKNKNQNPAYNADMEEQIAKVQQAGAAVRNAEDADALFAEAGKFIIEKDKASIGMLQRVFKIGFNRAARIMDQLSDAGVVGPEEGTKPRKILMSAEQFENYLEENG